MKILICNVGSSSFKFSLFGAEDEQLLAEGEIDWSAQPTGLVYRCRGQQEVRRELRLAAAISMLFHTSWSFCRLGLRLLWDRSARFKPSDIASCMAAIGTAPLCESRRTSNR